MTDREKVIEAMSRGMCNLGDTDPDEVFYAALLKKRVTRWTLYRKEAIAALSAIEAMGAVVVPVEATLKNFGEDRLEEIITDSIDLDWTPRTAARAIVRAMKGASDE